MCSISWGVGHLPLKRRRRLAVPIQILLVAALMFHASTAAQRTIMVPLNAATIQTGIDSAVNGDTVLVSPGVYNETIDFKGKSITVTSGAKSFSDAAVAATIISGEAGGIMAIFNTGETRASVLNGFTMQNGTATAISISASSATISNNVITNNEGCGITVIGATASPLIQGNKISRTKNAPTCGLPIVPYIGAPTGATAITLLDAGDVIVSGNTIEENGESLPFSQGTAGGAIEAKVVNSLHLENNLIRNNIFSYGKAPTSDDVRNLFIIQNLIYGNTDTSSSGIYLYKNADDYPPSVPINARTTSAVVVNNTVYGNVESNAPTGVIEGEQFYMLGQFVQTVVANSLFVSANTKAAASCGDGAESTVDFTRNDVLNSGEPVASSCGPNNGDQGNLSVDPLFVNASNGDFHVQPNSPSVAAGTVNVPGIPLADLDGKARTVCGTIDMGVYEVRPRPPAVVTSSVDPSVGGTSVTFTAHVPGNCNVPTGTVTFMDGANVIGTVPLDAGATASISTASLTVGSHNITATYPGDFNFDASTSGIFVQVVTGYPTAMTLQASPSPAKAFQPIAFSTTVSSQFGVPNGTVSFYVGATLLATAPVSPNGLAATTVNTLGGGTYTITAVYNASTTFASSRSALVTLVVIAAPSATTLSAQPNPVYQGQTVTFQAGVVGIQVPSPIATGTVQILDGTTSLGTVALNGGKAVVTTSSLSIGSHAITAVYSGDSNLAPSTSPAVTEVILGSSFTIGIAPGTVTIHAGQRGQTTLLGTSIGTYAGTLTLSSGQLPAYTTLAFTPASLTLTSGGTASSTLSINTGTLPPGVNGAAYNQEPAGIHGLRFPAALAALMALPIFLLRRRRLPVLLAVCAAVSLLAGSTGCTNIYHPFNSAAPGTYLIPITATDSATQITQTATLTLIITP